MKAGLHIFLQISILCMVQIDAWDQTAILVKKDVNCSDKDRRVIGGENFEQLIQRSGVWVDKSLLVKAIWDDDSANVFMNTCPRRWGKTINLEMIKFYHQIPLRANGSLAQLEDAPNYLYFKEGKIWNGIDWQQTKTPPLISKYPNHLRHLGKYPVIHLRGSSLSASPHEADIFFALMISDAYQEHGYLENSLRKNSGTSLQASDDWEMFQIFFHRYKSETFRWDMYVKSILTLSRILNTTFNEPVIILFDEFDGFVIDTYFKGSTLPKNEEWDQFAKYFQKFMECSFKSNKYLVKAVITGILPIREITGLSGMNNVVLKSVFGHQDLYPFYGIFEDEFQTMATLRKIENKKISEVSERYDGYRTLSHIGSPMYATLSVTKYISTLVLDDYWTGSSVTETVTQLLKHSAFMKDVALLMKNWQSEEKSVIGIRREKMLSLVKEDFEVIFNLKQKTIDYNSNSHRDIVFSLLLSMGYVSIDTKQDPDNPDVGIKIPNREIHHQYRRHFITSLGFLVPQNQTEVVSLSLRKFMQNNDKSTLFPLVMSMSNYMYEKMFLSDLGKLNDSIRLLSASFDRPFPHGNEAIAEFFLLGFFYTEMSIIYRPGELPINSYSVAEQLVHVDSDIKGSNTRIDIFFTDKKNTALVLEIKYDQKNDFHPQKIQLRNAFVQCLTYVQYFRGKTIDTKWVKLMAVIVHSNANMEVMAVCLMPNEIRNMLDNQYAYFSNTSSTPKKAREDWSNLMYGNLYENKRQRIWIAQYDRRKKYDAIHYLNEPYDVPPPKT